MLIQKHSFHQRQVRQLKYLLRQLRKATSPRPALLQRFKQLFKRQQCLPLSFKVRQAALALALTLGLQQVQAQSPFPTPPPVYQPFNMDLELAVATSNNLVDIDGDGDLDWVCGTTRYIPTSQYYYGYIGHVKAEISYQENIGTAFNPVYDNVVYSAFNTLLDTFNYSPYAVFGDLDDDGDLDMMVAYGGNSSSPSRIEYLENIGTATAPDFAAAVVTPMGIAATGFKIPTIQLVDIDGDGDLDLFASELDPRVGYTLGTVSMTFQENIGTAATPAFGPLQTNAFLPANPFHVDSENLYFRFADVDKDGDLDLTTHYAYYTPPPDPFSPPTKHNKIYYHTNTGTPTAPVFAAAQPYTQVFGFSPVALDFGDIDNDGDLDLFSLYDNYYGGPQASTRYYENTSTVTSAPAVNFTSTTLTVNEGVGTLTIAATLSPVVNYPVTVDVHMGARSSATNNLDVSLPLTQTLTFPANSPLSQTFTLPIQDDIIVEDPEVVLLHLVNPTNNARLGLDYTMEITINDNDVGTPILNFSNTFQAVNEPVGTVSIPISITNPSGNATTFEVSLDPSSTAGANDCGLNLPLTQTFAPNATAPLVLQVPIVDDRNFEPTEDLVLRITNVTNSGNAGASATTTIRIQDNDPTTTVRTGTSTMRTRNGAPLLPPQPSGGTNPALTAKALQATVYPNPFQQTLTLEVKTPLGHSWRLVNTLGQVLIEQPLTKRQTSIATGELATGIYWLQVYEESTGEPVWQERVVKQ